MSRRKLRIMAMKIVYQQELGTFNGIYLEYLNLKPEDEMFLKGLINFADTKKKLIKEINSCLNDWAYERLGILERSIFLLGFQELLNFDNIPANVSIDEWVDISKEYCGEEAKKLVNGVLNNYKNMLIKN